MCARGDGDENGLGRPGPRVRGCARLPVRCRVPVKGTTLSVSVTQLQWWCGWACCFCLASAFFNSPTPRRRVEFVCRQRAPPGQAGYEERREFRARGARVKGVWDVAADPWHFTVCVFPLSPRRHGSAIATSGGSSFEDQQAGLGGCRGGADRACQVKGGEREEREGGV
ncbi:hypothetical protein F5X68DRAFT_56254 [Plectosphaerella plurivora]|uniref:Uncharacterized protein n=1 Tax=Plectosphaerella plurivora TaxID=936078 RepID=A0A9P8UZL2_9PEZI|nr:hypothetical protein F5X68DRAFT_56254 [Plectosphaerella plurivora]